MKKKIPILTLSVILSISSVMAINSYAAEKIDEIKGSAPLVLREYENCVALYRGSELLEIFETVNLAALPEYDRIRLKKGIAFDSIKTVYSVIEDYDG